MKKLKNQVSRVFAAATTMVLLLVAIGCGSQDGPPLAEVNGVVTLDGKPVENAGLEFIADAGGVAYGKSDDSGRYRMYFGSSRTGAIVGRNLVRITSGDKITVGDKKLESTEVFPGKYNVNSEQFVEVTKGSNDIDFKCESGNFKDKTIASRGGN